MLTKKDYIKIAEIFEKEIREHEELEYNSLNGLNKHTGLSYKRGRVNTLDHLLHSLILFFEENNPNFNREKFLQAIKPKDLVTW